MWTGLGKQENVSKTADYWFKGSPYKEVINVNDN